MESTFLSEENQIKEILTQYRVVAVVGLSGTVGKPSHRVGAYLKQHGFSIIPVNPYIEEVLGKKSYKSLLDIPPETQEKLEIVCVFRKAQDVPSIVDQAIELKKKHGKPFVVWMQLGIVNEQ